MQASLLSNGALVIDAETSGVTITDDGHIILRPGMVCDLFLLLESLRPAIEKRMAQFDIDIPSDTFPGYDTLH